MHLYSSEFTSVMKERAIKDSIAFQKEVIDFVYDLEIFIFIEIEFDSSSSFPQQYLGRC